jgi:hypothetical protein
MDTNPQIRVLMVIIHMVMRVRILRKWLEVMDEWYPIKLEEVIKEKKEAVIKKEAVTKKVLLIKDVL